MHHLERPTIECRHITFHPRRPCARRRALGRFSKIYFISDTAFFCHHRCAGLSPARQHPHSLSSSFLFDLHVEYLSVLPRSRVYASPRLASSRQATAAHLSPFRSGDSVRPFDDKPSYRAVARLWFLTFYWFSCRAYRSRRSFYASPLPQVHSFPLRDAPLASRASIPFSRRPNPLSLPVFQTAASHTFVLFPPNSPLGYTSPAPFIAQLPPCQNAFLRSSLLTMAGVSRVCPGTKKSRIGTEGW